MDECNRCGGGGIPDGWYSCEEELDPNETSVYSQSRVRELIEADGGKYKAKLRITYLWELAADYDMWVYDPNGGYVNYS